MANRLACLHAIAVAVFILPVAAVSQTVQYKVIPVMSPYNTDDVAISGDMNKAGTVPSSDFTNGLAFVWKRGSGGSPLALLGGTCGTAVGINAGGHIVGGACPSGGSVPHAYLYRKGAALDLGTFGGVSAAGVAVNSHDQVTGTYTLNNGTVRAFFWSKQQSVDLGRLGGRSNLAFDLNSSGTVTGQSDISKIADSVYGIPPTRAYTWSSGTISSLGPLFGGNFSAGYSINDSGQVVGSSDLAGDTEAHAFLWDHGTVQDLAPFDGVVTFANSVNNQGIAVGGWGSFDDDPADGPPDQVILCPCSAVLWKGGQTYFLNGLVPPEWDLLLAVAINDRGEILVRGRRAGERLRLLLLKPIVVGASEGQAVSTMPTPRRWASGGPHAMRRTPDGKIHEID